MIERVRAIIIENQRVILVKRIKQDETFWVLPGGEVEPGETHQQALIYKGISSKPKTEGQPEYYFTCKIISGQPGTGQGPEFQPNNYYFGRHVIEWVDLAKLSSLEFKPKEIRDLLYKKYYNENGGKKPSR